MDRLSPQPIAPSRPCVMHNVGETVKLWGRRGLWGGAIAGFGLGAVFVSFPTTSAVLAFGALGTLVVATVECAVVAGVLGACAAALYGSGVTRGRGIRIDRVAPIGRRVRDQTWPEGDVPLPDFPRQMGISSPTAAPVIAHNAHSRQERNRDTGTQQHDGTGPQFGNFKRDGTTGDYPHPGR